MSKIKNKKDSFELSNTKEASAKIFLNDVIKSDKSDEVLKAYNFSQYGKKGIPLKYSRKDFVSDIDKALRFSPDNLPNNVSYLKPSSLQASLS